MAGNGVFLSGRSMIEWPKLDGPAVLLILGAAAIILEVYIGLQMGPWSLIWGGRRTCLVVCLFLVKSGRLLLALSAISWKKGELGTVPKQRQPIAAGKRR